jgi:hypothetical protein
MAKGKKQKDPFGLPKMEIPQKGPKTLRGMMRKGITGDGRKSTPMEKAVKEANKVVEETFFGKRKKQRKKK